MTHSIPWQVISTLHLWLGPSRGSERTCCVLLDKSKWLFTAIACRTRYRPMDSLSRKIRTWLLSRFGGRRKYWYSSRSNPLKRCTNYTNECSTHRIYGHCIEGTRSLSLYLILSDQLSPIRWPYQYGQKDCIWRCIWGIGYVYLIQDSKNIASGPNILTITS
jgi:hypothetical protein